MALNTREIEITYGREERQGNAPNRRINGTNPAEEADIISDFSRLFMQKNPLVHFTRIPQMLTFYQICFIIFPLSIFTVFQTVGK